jgi:hypothetical protein
MTAKYIVEYTLAGTMRMDPIAWQGQADRDGRPTQKNLARHVRVLMESAEPGGCNAHLGTLDIIKATLRVNERDGTVKAEHRVQGCCVCGARIPKPYITCDTCAENADPYAEL